MYIRHLRLVLQEQTCLHHDGIMYTKARNMHMYLFTLLYYT